MKLSFVRIKKDTRAFSIIEFLAALSLFVIIISMAVSIFLRALRTQKTALLLMEANDNASLIIEGMSLEIRPGINFKSNGKDLEFSMATTGDFIRYQLKEDYLEKGVKKTIEGEFDYQRITPDSIGINDFRIFLGPTNNYPPRITVSLAASPKDEFLKDIAINIQTTISSRFIE